MRRPSTPTQLAGIRNGYVIQEADRLREVFADSEMARGNRLVTAVGRIRAGFHLTDAQLGYNATR